MLKLLSFSFSPSAFRASLQTSTFQARNLTAGAQMSIFEKIDTTRHRRDINLCKPVSQPDATGFSVEEPDATKLNPPAFSDDYSTEHTIPGKSVTPIGSSALKPPVY
jgi:hypothetical protein